MNKMVALCIMAVIIGAFPVYAADSSNLTASNMNHDAYNEIKSTFAQIQNINPDIASDINRLEEEFMQDNLQITEIVKNNNVQTLIVNLLQNRGVRFQIHDLVQNKDVQNEINRLMQNEDIKEATNTLMENQEINKAVGEIVKGN